MSKHSTALVVYQGAVPGGGFCLGEEKLWEQPVIPQEPTKIEKKPSILQHKYFHRIIYFAVLCMYTVLAWYVIFHTGEKWFTSYSLDF